MLAHLSFLTSCSRLHQAARWLMCCCCLLGVLPPELQTPASETPTQLR